MNDRQSLSKHGAQLTPEQRTFVEQRLRGDHASPNVAAPIPRRSDPARAPLSFSQQRLWFLDQSAPGNIAYNESTVLHLRGHLDADTLEESIQDIVDRHEILRTTFAVLDGHPSQIIATSLRIRVARIDLKDLDPATREAEARRLAHEDARAPFDLERGPLLRATVVALDPREHLLLLSNHQIVFDAWSRTILVRELGLIYTALRRGEPPSLPPLAVQYGDYAAWQRAHFASGALDRQLAYWKEHQKVPVETLELPSNRPRPAEQSLRGATIDVRLSPVLSERLATGLPTSNTNPYMNLLAGFAACLHHHSGQSEVVIGFPVAGRDRVEFEPMIGFFANSLVVTVSFDGDPTFCELVEYVRTSSVAAYASAAVPFERLLEELHPSRDPSRSPLFQVELALRTIPAIRFDLPDLSLEVSQTHAGTTRLDLILDLISEAARLNGKLAFSTDLLDRDTVGRFIARLDEFLDDALARPNARISELNVLPPTEEDALLTTFNNTARVYDVETPFAEAFGKAVARTPDAVAVVAGDTQWTYRELDARAKAVAGYLVEARLEQEAVVAVLAARDANFLATMIGIWKAGAAYLPLDPRHPAERIARIVRDSGAVVVVVDAASQALAEEALTKLETKPALAPMGALTPSGHLAMTRMEIHSRSLAYVIYTSGTTGAPKGAMLEHRGMMNHLRAKIEELGIGPYDTVAQTASACFDISIWQFLSALLVGARVWIASDEIALDSYLLAREAANNAVTVLETVPSLLDVLLDELEQSGAPKLSLRWMIPTGEALPPALVKRWFARFPEVPLVNAYGPTECSDDVTHHVLCGPMPEGAAHTPIGRPIGNTQVYILDSAHRPVPLGVPGEIYVGGAGVGRGYLGRPDLTAAAFVPDPFRCATTSTGRLYRTGDLGRFLPDGTLVFLGRIDHQVKIRGYRIELGEIEAVLCAHEAVDRAVVLARQGRDGGRLAAYVVASRSDTEAASLTAALAARLRCELPEYMIPAITLLPALPVTPNGKIDRAALLAR
ncbi:amino acid adenylation domain-containing protein [Pendulispora brunnea]|uniref:Amino acid adenylation domain-containing protein n=1 Tax=Pendulispora brunnea TaxID=2905690 RepID=A0ABZ2KJG0_9BACT